MSSSLQQLVATVGRGGGSSGSGSEQSERFELLRDVKQGTHRMFESYSLARAQEERGELATAAAGRVLTERDPVVRELLQSVEACLWHGLRVHLAFGARTAPLTLWAVVGQLLEEGGGALLGQQTDVVVREAVAKALQAARDLTACETDLGRSRAWVRAALNYKALASSLSLLVSSKQGIKILEVYYEPYAILRDQESSSFLIAMLAGLDGIDFSLEYDVEAFDERDPPPRRSTEFLLAAKQQEAATANKNSPAPIDEALSKADQSKNEKTATELLNAHALRKKLSKEVPSPSSPTMSASSSAILPSAIHLLQSTLFGSGGQAKTQTSANSGGNSSITSLLPSIWSYVSSGSAKGGGGENINPADPFGKSLSSLIMDPKTCNAALLDWEVGIPNIVVRCVSTLLRNNLLDVPELFTSQSDLDQPSVLFLKNSLVALGDEGLPPPWRDVLVPQQEDMQGRPLLLGPLDDPFAIVSLLKLFLRQLPEPLIPFDSYDAYIACYAIADPADRNRNLKCLVEMLEPAHVPTLCALIGLLHEAGSMERSQKSGCDWFSAASAFAPAVLRPRPWKKNSSSDLDVEPLSLTLGKPGEAAEILGIMVENRVAILSDVERTLGVKRGNLAGKVGLAFRIHRELREPISAFSSPEQEKLLKRLWVALAPRNKEELMQKITASRERERRNSIASLTEKQESRQARGVSTDTKNSEDVAEEEEIVTKERADELDESLNAEYGPISSGWKVRGFQTAHPAHDLRGGGVAGLRDVVYLAEHFGDKATAIVARSNTLYPHRGGFYPFIQAAVQMSVATAELLGFGDPKLDIQKLATEQSWPILGDLDASHRAFCMSFLLMDAEWVASGEDVMVFNRVKLDIKAIMAELFSSRPKTVDALWELWIERKRIRLGVLRMEESWGGVLVGEKGNAQERRNSSASDPLAKQKSERKRRKSGGGGGEAQTEGDENTNHEGVAETDAVAQVDESFSLVNLDSQEVASVVALEKEILVALPQMVGEVPSVIFDQKIHSRAIEAALPIAYQGYNFQVVFSSVKNGENLELLYRLCAPHPATLLVVKEVGGRVFGGFVTTPWAIHSTYYGSGESFLFTFPPESEGGGIETFYWTEADSYFQYSTEDGLGMGGGGKGFGLYLDGDLKAGTSEPCSTFANTSLSGSSSDFICQTVEVWTLVPSLR